MALEAGRPYSFDRIGPKPVPAGNGEYSLVAIKNTPDNPTMMLIDSLRSRGVKIELKPILGNPDSEMMYVQGENAADVVSKAYCDPVMWAIREAHDGVLHKRSPRSIIEDTGLRPSQIKVLKTWSLLNNASYERDLAHGVFYNIGPWKTTNKEIYIRESQRELRHNITAIEERVKARKLVPLDKQSLLPARIKAIVEEVVVKHLVPQGQPQ